MFEPPASTRWSITFDLAWRKGETRTRTSIPSGIIGNIPMFKLPKSTRSPTICTVAPGVGRNPSELFDTYWYLRTNADVSRAGLNPLAHYLQRGAAEGRAHGQWYSGSGAVVPARIDRYAAWLACNSTGDNSVQALREALAARSGRLPRISVVMPVYNTPDGLLNHAIRSVVDQVYDDWELCIADDASTDPRVAEDLQRWAAGDDRIRIVRRGENGGIALATNSAATLATGEFLVFLDHDDV